VEPRLDYKRAAPGAFRALLAPGEYLATSELDPKLLNLVELRASQINGCAYCLDMHSKDLRALGESEQRIYVLDAWRDAPFYTDRERAALAWTEAVTSLPNREVPDNVYDEARRHFSARELVDLTLAITAINSWNRMNIAFRSVAGSYQPRALAHHPEPAAATH